MASSIELLNVDTLKKSKYLPPIYVAQTGDDNDTYGLTKVPYPTFVSEVD